MRLSASAFNGFLNGIGQTFERRTAFACPCVNPHSGAPSPTCSTCHGKGRYWANPVTGTAGIVGRSQLNKFAQFGEFDLSDTVLTIPSDSAIYDIGQYDRVLALNRTEPFSMNLIRGVNDILRFKSVSIDRVSWFNSNNQLVIGDIPRVDENGTLIWSGVMPTAQTNFSLTGRRTPEYFVYMDLPLDRPFHHGETLPRRVVLRRWDLFGR